MPRPAKPRALHRLEGTLNATRHRGIEPEAGGALSDLEPPDGLTPRQLELWHAVLADAPLALLRRIDAALLLGWVTARATFEIAAEQQRRLDEGSQLPLLIRTAGGPQVSPYVAIMARMMKELTALARQMGFSPAARASLGLHGADRPARPDPADTPWNAIARHRQRAGGRGLVLVASPEDTPPPKRLPKRAPPKPKAERTAAPEPVQDAQPPQPAADQPRRRWGDRKRRDEGPGVGWWISRSRIAVGLSRRAQTLSCASKASSA